MEKAKDKVSLWDVRGRFRAYNRQHGIGYDDVPSKDVRDISAVIVFKASNWTKPYSEQERSYRVTNRSGKAFFEGMRGQSMLGDCLDGLDVGVRLDAYGWDVDYCYFE